MLKLLDERETEGFKGKGVREKEGGLPVNNIVQLPYNQRKDM